MDIKTNTFNLTNYKKYLLIEETTLDFLKKQSFLKIDLPVLSSSLIPESYLEIFETEFNYLEKKEKLYLTPSPELFLKRLLVEGIGDCFYLGKSFRNNDPSSSLHSFEFTMLEIYKMGVDYMKIADLVLNLLKAINKNIKKTEVDILDFNGNKISLKKWEKISVTEAFEKYSQISKKELFDHQLFIDKAEKKGYRINNFTYEELWSQIYTMEIEPNLGVNGYPTIIYDYPSEFAALAKLNKDGITCQRFEFYIQGIELGDCYSELTNWQEQEKRFKLDSQKRKKDGKIIHPVDKGFIDSLKKGLKDCAGVAIGFDRLAMIFTNVSKIEDLKLINIS